MGTNSPAYKIDSCKRSHSLSMDQRNSKKTVLTQCSHTLAAPEEMRTAPSFCSVLLEDMDMWRNQGFAFGSRIINDGILAVVSSWAAQASAFFVNHLRAQFLNSFPIVVFKKKTLCIPQKKKKKKKNSEFHASAYSQNPILLSSLVAALSCRNLDKNQKQIPVNIFLFTVR